MRIAIAFLVGSIFGLGLFTSGMTDTTKVQGWLDFFGDWDPTLAFVMGGAIIPMSLAWYISRGKAPVLAAAFPAAVNQQLDRRLVMGSILFGAGWGLSGLCPGPAIASLSFGGWGGAAFALAMVLGMIGAPHIARRLDGAPGTG